ncbi:MAG: hypothetical protein ACK5XU_08065 [Pseudomonadota bacterium]|jgi:hypothetical protein
MPQSLSRRVAATLLASAAAAAAVVPATAQPVGGAGFDPASSVAAIVKVPRPWYAPRFVVEGRMRDAVPQFESLPGLNFKAYSFARADGHYGGIYLWTDLAAARAWFAPAWFERVRRERGAEGQVRLFEVPLVLDNTPGGTSARTSARGGAAPVATLVEIPVPPGVGRAALLQGFRDALPTYRKVPGLLRKYFILSDAGRFGGIYLWQDEASARAWHDQAWQDRVAARYGQPATVEWFDTPILQPGRGAEQALPEAVLVQAR